MPATIMLTGPTATGKTAIALQLATEFAAEIVSVDSALIYRQMDIGTAKPSAAEQAQIAHHLLDILDPSQSYSVAKFQHQATRAIADIHRRGKMAILTGGTMLYFNALNNGLSQLPPADNKLRAQLQQQLEQQGAVAMHRQLATCDKEAAAKIHHNDRQRIVRALEVFQLSGKKLSDWHKFAKKSGKLAQVHARIALCPASRDQHRQLVKQRFLHMLESGLVAEVDALYRRGDLHLNLPAMRSVGYRQVWQYLEGKYDYKTMVELAVTATRQLAKRQMTWLRKQTNWQCFDSQNLQYAQISAYVQQVLEKTTK